MTNVQTFISLSKDILYLIGSVLGIIGFFRTLKKRDYCSFNFKTDFGNEVEPYLICLRADMYNVSVATSERSVMVEKYPASSVPSYDNRRSVSKDQIDRASFFPVIKEHEYLVIDNRSFKMGTVVLKYQDRFHNYYKQEFSFDEKDAGNLDRINRTSRSCYLLTKRSYRFLYLWLPLRKKVLK